MKRALGDCRGAALAEFIVVAGPLFLTFFALVQLAGGYTAKLMTEHSARVAARAAIVIAPPNPGAPKDANEQVLRAAELAFGPWKTRGRVKNVRLDLKTPREPHGPVTVRVRATYACDVPVANRVVCGLTREKELVAEATLTSQGAAYRPFRKTR